MSAIEKNIPLPENHKKPKYPFSDMQVGDSFFIQQGKKKTINASAARYAMLQNPRWKFVLINIDDGCRCWRTE